MTSPAPRRGSSASRRRASAGTHASGHLPVWALIVIDVLVTGICLLIFAYFHHVRVPAGNDGPISSSVKNTAAPTATVTPAPTPTADATVSGDDAAVGETPVPTPSPTPLPADIGQFGEKFADHFLEIGEETIQTPELYRSRDVEITMKKVQENDVTYFIADIYLRNVENFRTAFADGSYSNNRQEIAEISQDVNALVGISGDYYGLRYKSYVLRNGDLYRDAAEGWDVCVLYYDGTMETYSPNEFDLDTAMNRGAWQIWQFGPELLDNGAAMDKFNSDVPGLNPRSSMGYYEPGHYCFIVVDGRQEGYSKGMTLAELSQLYESLGCKAAFNLDGGATAIMTQYGERISKPYKGGRDQSDIVYIGEVQE